MLRGGIRRLQAGDRRGTWLATSGAGVGPAGQGGAGTDGLAGAAGRGVEAAGGEPGGPPRAAAA
eukprot:3680235-Pleurochrysis_carterae.AAC.1